MARRYGSKRKNPKRVAAGKKAWRNRKKKGGHGRRGKPSKAAARRGGRKAWLSFVRRHGGVAKAKAALRRRFGKGRRKGRR